MLIVRLQHSKTLGEPSDFVSYRGPRSMVTVDISVEPRSIIGDDLGNIVPL